ncbi:MAG: phosphatidylglycerol lysyltransferase domain-containing protein [Ktedonobacteraceae bacterium]
MLQKAPTTEITQSPQSHKRRRIRAILGLLTGLIGLANLLTIILSRETQNVWLGVWMLDTYHNVHKLLAVMGFFLVMLVYGIVRGKRQAWIATVILLALSAFLSTLAGRPLIATTLVAAPILLLLACTRHFQAKSDPPTLRRGYIALLAGLSIVTLYSIGGLIMLYDQFELLVNRFGLVEVWFRLLTNAHLPRHLFGVQAFFFGRVLSLLALSAVLYGIALILRPVAAKLLPNEQEHHVARALTHTYGTNSISYFALEAEKSFFFSHSRKAFISYVLEGSVAVVAGDPLGPPEEMLPIIEQFVSFCDRQDWSMVFWQVRDTYTELYRQAGMHLLKIGEDPIIDTETFTLAGKAMANARTSARHAEKAGLNIVFYHGQVQDAEQRTQMEQISQAWLIQKNGAEMGFSMGRFEVEGDNEQVYALAVDINNQVCGFLSFVPIYGRKGWGIDLMRRAPQVPGGMMELLIVRSVAYLKASGAEMVSLGLAPMNNVNQSDASRLEASMEFLANVVGDLKKKASLCTFKKKFQPAWESRYLVYSSKLGLPKASWALYRAHQCDATVSRTAYQAVSKWRTERREARLQSGCEGFSSEKMPSPSAKAVPLARVEQPVA